MIAFISRLRSLSPFGPIFGKELRVTSRRKRTYLLRTFYLLVLFLILLAFYAGTHGRYGQTTVVRTAQGNAELGQEFLAVFGMFSTIAMAVLGPVLTATAISEERQHKTLAVLMMTPLSAWQIVAGKLFSRLLIAATLLGLSLPSLAVVRLLGGIEAWQVAAVLSLAFATAIFTAALGLFFSTVASRAYVAIILAYAMLLLLWALVPTALTLMAELSGQQGESRAPFAYMAVALPMFQIAIVAANENVPFKVGDWTVCVAFLLTLSTGLLLLTSSLVRRRTRREMAGEIQGVSVPAAAPPLPPPPLPATAPSPVGQTPPALVAPPPPPADRRRPVSDNPVLWREVRRPLFAKRWQRVVAATIILGCLIFMYALIDAAGHHNALYRRDTHAAFACIFDTLFIAITCILSATTISGEKESDTWNLLIAAPLSAGQIVWGKLAGQFRRLLWPMLLIVANFVVFCVLGAVSVTSVAVVVWIIASTNLLWVVTGLYLSLRLRSTTFAAVLNLCLPLILYVGMLLLAAIYDGFTRHYPEPERATEYVQLYTPHIYLYEGVHLSVDRRDSWTLQTRSEADLPTCGSVSINYFLGATAIVGILHLAVAGGVLAWIILRFDVIVGRARQQDPRPPVR